MKRAKTYFRILVDDSPVEDFPTLDAALCALRDPEYDSIRNKHLVSGHWQGKGEWKNFVIDSVLLLQNGNDKTHFFGSDEDREIYYIEDK